MKKELKRFFYPAFLFIGLLSTLNPASHAALPAAPPVPSINAKAYILQDFDSGIILASEKADEKMEPASLTKLMTAYIAFDELKQKRLKLTDQVLISERAWRTPGSRTFVEVGKRIPVQELLLGVIVQSGNDATVALAEHIAGSEDVFANLMNEKAKSLGMQHSHYMNSTGLPHPEHYSTAKDLAILARALIVNFPQYYQWYAVKEHAYNGITQYNRNLLLWKDRSVDGIKTGHTESAGYCLVASAKRGEMRLVSVVLGAKSENGRAEESAKILNYGFRFFETHRLYSANQTLKKVRIWKGEADNVAGGINQPIIITIPRGQYSALKASINLPERIMAPVKVGQKLGTVSVALSGEKLAELPLVAMENVPESGFISRLIDDVKLMLE